MNKERRSRIKSLLLDLEEIKSGIEEIRDEEEESIGSLEEYFPESPQIERMEEIRDLLDSVYDSLDSATMEIEEVVE